jgi:hypothetical protein
MKTGQINHNVGFTATSGVQRKLTIRDRLGQIAMSRQPGILEHPMLGKIEVTSRRAKELLEMHSEENLVRLKRLLFQPAGERKD